MQKPNLQHLRDYNITWWQHLCRSIKWAWVLQKTAVALVIHSIFPWIFTTTASTNIIKVASEMEEISRGKQK